MERKPEKKEIVILLFAVTKGGKTTLATTLCREDIRPVMDKITNCRTEVTVDWTYDPDADGIILEEALLNDKGVFGVDDGAEVTCEGFNQILESDPGKYLKDVLRLESQSGLSSAELKEYVLGKLREYVENSDADKLAELIKNRLSNKFLCRLKVLLPPTAAWNDFFEEKGVRLVLRDTRGLLDMEPQETEAIQRMTTRELGIDGIHAVLVLGSGAAFPDITQKLYRNAYKSVFESAPVFIMNRSDAFRTLYRQRYGRDATACMKRRFLRT